MFKLHLISQLPAALFAVVLAFVWYNPKVLGKFVSTDENKISKPLIYGLLFILAFVITFGLKHTIINIHAAFESVSEHPFSHGALHGFYIAIIYGAVPAIAALCILVQKKWLEIIVHSVYWLLAISVMGGIIGFLG